MFQPGQEALQSKKGLSLRVISLTFLPPGEEASGGGVLVIFNGLEPQLEGDDPLILSEKRGVGYTAFPFLQWCVRGGGEADEDLE